MALFVFVATYYFPENPNEAISKLKEKGILLAAVILNHNFKSIVEIRSNFIEKKVKVLLVPGHEPDYGGSEYRGLIERDMNVELAQDLQEFFKNNSHYQVFISRDEKDWSPFFQSYFKEDWSEIVKWTNTSIKEFSRLVAIGSTTKPASKVIHNKAPANVSYRLFGITKWSNENNVDVVIHIHFNDNPRYYTRGPGKYSGFAIYVPTAQFDNSTTTKAIASRIYKRLAKYDPVSNLPGESSGIIDEPDLIAVGANNTSDAASLLIEYSYIYEPQFQDAKLRQMAIKDLAFQTYLGIQDFFGQNAYINLTRAYDTSILPYDWGSDITDESSRSDIYALQTALTFDHEYPPEGKSKNECPRTGRLGPCTLSALETFQEKYGIVGEDGFAGPKTIKDLNNL